jgi:hypothetical protein
MYKPLCAFSCRAVISASALNCSTVAMDMPGMAGMDMGTAETTPECYATDDVFLQTLAFCMSNRCTGLADWKLERYWKKNVAGTAEEGNQPDPKETYGEALTKAKAINEEKMEVMVSGDPLNKTSLVGEDDYQMNWNAQMGFETAEDTHERYG